MERKRLIKRIERLEDKFIRGNKDYFSYNEFERVYNYLVKIDEAGETIWKVKAAEAFKILGGPPPPRFTQIYNRLVRIGEEMQKQEQRKNLTQDSTDPNRRSLPSDGQ